MRISFLLACIFVLLQSQLYAQQMVFPASELKNRTAELTGNPNNWPVIVELARHDISSNTFILSQENILRLQNLSSIENDIVQQKARIGKLIEEGATIFAKNQLERTQKIITDYSSYIEAGDIEAASAVGMQINMAVEQLDSTLTANRIVDIEAKLVNKEGEVDKRKGILRGWEEAFIGDLFEETDGVRTYDESFAKMTFVDGSDIIVNPNTTAIIRKSRIDKLDEYADTEVTLVEGKLLTKLSAIGKERNQFILRAGSSESELKTQNFFAETDTANRVRLTNYDGQANVTANDVTISIYKNEGTIIEEGKAPRNPVKLLPAPELMTSATDTVINKSEFVFRYKPVNKAAGYRIQYSNSSNFDDEVNEVETKGNTVTFSGIQKGSTYVKVQAIDSLGLAGPYSRFLRIVRNEDRQPPPVFIAKSQNDILYINSDTLNLRGVTETGTSLQINSETVRVKGDGSFEKPMLFTQAVDTITVVAKDPAQNKTTKKVTVVNLTKKLLSELKWQNAAEDDGITVFENPVTVSGQAFPSLLIELTNNGTVKRVKTDLKGRWGVIIPLNEGKLEIKIKDPSTDETYISRTFNVQLAE